MDKRNHGRDNDRKNIGRREVLKGTGIAAAAAAAGAVNANAVHGATGNAAQPRNPYGTPPGYGITLPEYYRPTPSVSNRNFFPPGEVLADLRVLDKTPMSRSH